MTFISARAAVAVTLGAAGVFLAGCETTAPDNGSGFSGPAELALFGNGYPNAGDPCRRAGESAVTVDYLDDAADLVACPPSTDAGLFASMTGGREVGRYQGWILFSVPTR